MKKIMTKQIKWSHYAYRTTVKKHAVEFINTTTNSSVSTQPKRLSPHFIYKATYYSKPHTQHTPKAGYNRQTDSHTTPTNAKPTTNVQ